jgi:hypothetical protein
VSLSTYKEILTHIPDLNRWVKALRRVEHIGVILFILLLFRFIVICFFEVVGVMSNWRELGIHHCNSLTLSARHQPAICITRSSQPFLPDFRLVIMAENVKIALPNFLKLVTDNSSLTMPKAMAIAAKVSVPLSF